MSDLPTAWPAFAAFADAATDLGDELARTGLDACTLNNALNIAQLVVLVALLRWVRQSPAGD